MTIDEAIQHCEEVAKEQDKLCKRYDDASGYTRSHNEDIRTTDAKKCAECAEEHRQLAEWLKELKALKEQTDTLNKIRAEIGMYEADCRLQGGTDECEKCNSNVFGSIYRIIDKYKAESEAQGADSD